MTHSRVPPVLHYLRTRFGSAEAAESDGQLLQRFTDCPDGAAFETLLVRHGPLVWSVCRRALRNVQDVEDAFQATFLVLARNAASIRKQASLSSWLHGVARRIALKARADVQRRARTELVDGPVRQADATAEASLREVRTILDEEILLLPERLRVPVVLCCLEGRTKAEASRQLGWNKGTLASRLARARQRLRSRLARRGVVLSSGAVGLLLADKAAVPPSVTAATLRLSVLCVAGEAGLTGAVSSQVTALARGGLPTMTVTRLKAVLTLAVVLTALAAGAGYSARQVSALERGEVQRADEPAAKGEGVPAPQADKQERTDFYGDPLPPGARVRLGSVQFRHPSANVVFSADGKTLVSGGLDGAVCFWDVATGKRVQRRQLRTPQGSFGRMHVVLVAPGGKVVVAWDNDEEAFLYDTATGKELRRIPTGRNWHRVLFSPDGKFLATTQSAAGHHSILLWDVATGKEHPTLESKRCTGFDVAFASDSERMASLDRDGADAILRVWDTTSGRELRNVRMEQKKNREALSVAFSPDGKAVAVTDRSGAVTLWEAATLQKQGELKPAKAGWTYSCVTAYSPDGASLAVAGDTDLVLWDVAARRELHRLPAWTPQGSTNCLAFTPDGRTLARAGENEVDLWDVATGKRLHDRPGHDRYATSVAVSPDGKVVATASLYDPTVRLWEVATGKPLSPGLRHDSSVRSCDFSSDGKLVITGGATDGTLRFWEPATQKEVRRFVIKDLNNGGEKHEILVCHLTPDGKRLAAISEPLGGGTTPENCQLTVWDARTGEILARRRFAGDLSSRFTPDGKGVTADTVERLVLEEVITGKERLKMWGDLGHPVAFSPDGILLAVGVHKTLPGNQSINGRNLGTENVRVAEVMTGQELFHVDGRINFVAFSRDGRVLATADGEALSLREAVTGRLLFRRPWPRDPAAVSRVFAPLQSLAFHPDGRSVATGMADGTVLIWDTAIEDWPAPTVAPKLDALWTDLAGDTPGACRAVRALTAEPARAVRFLKDHLRPVREADPERVQRLIAELDSDQFAVRKSAGEELAKLGEQIEPALRKALEGQPSPEVRRRITEVLEAMKTAPAADTLRTRRAIQILQRLGTAEARQILQTLATGAPAARETREAREALASLTVTTP